LIDGNGQAIRAYLVKLDEPVGLIDLPRAVAARLPRVDLTQVLLEVLAWTDLASEFRHISEGHAQISELGLSVCTVLLAEACNIGLEPLIRPDVPTLTRSRLSWVQQNYIRAETITKANARLVDYQAKIPLAQASGGGEVAPADGMRFVVPVRTLNAGPNSTKPFQNPKLTRLSCPIRFAQIRHAANSWTAWKCSPKRS
jgi:hypothetical protein